MNNSKNKKIIFIVFIALLSAGLAFVGTYFFFNPQRTTMYVFNENYKAGEVLTKDMLSPVSVDAKILVSGKTADTQSQFVTDANISAVIKKGNSLRMDVSAGMPLTTSLLSSFGGSSIEQGMDTSKIAISVPVSGITGVTNDLKKGSRVNIYSVDANTGAAVLILQNMRVLETTTGDDKSLTAATIECDQNQALQLTYYSTQSVISFGLVDGSSYQAVEGTPSFKPSVTK